MSTKPQVLALDIYGTILDTSAMGVKITEIQPAATKSLADELCVTWRKYQLEYTWRLTAMGLYEPFDVVTKQSLQHAIAEHNAQFLNNHVDEIMKSYNELQPFPGARAALEALAKIDSVKLVVFSNGTLQMVTSALKAAGLSSYVDGVFVVDFVKTYKPAKKVYEELVNYINKEDVRPLGAIVAPEDVWLVSGNPFDVTGARSSGLNAIWVNRSSPQGWVDGATNLQPSAIVSELGEVVRVLEGLP